MRSFAEFTLSVANGLRMTVVFLACLFLPYSASALSIPEKPEGTVNDYAGLLSDTAKIGLSQTLSQFEQETSNQVVVAIFQSLEGGSLEDFSIKLAEKWKPGQKDRDNGVILLIFKEDRAVRIEVGYGLEGALPDAIASQIIYNEIVPQFKGGNFDAGVLNGIHAIIQATKGEYKASPRVAVTEEKARLLRILMFLALVFFFLLPPVCYLLVIATSTMYLGFPFGAVFGVILTAFLVAFRAMSGGTTYSHSRGSLWGGGGSWGGGGFSGGGFSGGGGSFGGGGASGRW